MMSEGFQVGNESIQFGLADFILVKGRHGPKTMPDLRTNGKLRQRLIVDRRAEPGFSTGMTLMTMGHEYQPALRDCGR